MNRDKAMKNRMICVLLLNPQTNGMGPIKTMALVSLLVSIAISSLIPLDDNRQPIMTNTMPITMMIIERI